MTRSITKNLALFAVAAGFAMPAAAEIKYENGSGGSVLLYGQIDPGYLSFNDGVSTTSELVDNSSSNTRVGLWVRQQYGENLFTFNFETALGFRPSAGLSQGVTPKGVNWQRTNIRKVDFALKTARYGTFSVGQGSMATDGVAEEDFSGTALVMYSSVPDVAGGFRFRTTAGVLSARSIGGAFGNFDGGRLGRVRYDTPNFNGFSVSASYGDNILSTNVVSKTSDIALRYAGDAGDFKLKGAVGYKHVELAGGVTFNDTIGSFSLLHASGFNATIAAGNRSTSGSYGYGKLGYKADWFSVGETALSVDYYDGSDRVSPGSSSTSYGVGAVQKFDKYRVEAYLGYRNYALSETAVSYQDASSVIFGARLKF